MNPHRYMVFGFQNAGKTTFAAALWHLLDSRELKTALEKGLHQGDFRYLEEISGSWSEGWEVAHTTGEQLEDIAVKLKHPQSNEEITLEFTDLPGERFATAFAGRLCSPKFVELVNGSSGMLLFVSADRKIEGVTILEAFGADKQAKGQTDEATPAKAGADAAASPAGEPDDAPWIAENTPLQVQIVDLLQAMQLPPFTSKPLRVAVIVSAWDLSNETSPDIWLSKRMPLLDQYLRSGQGVADVRVYGVSAQGGQLSKKEKGPGPDRERLLKVQPPSRRIKIVGIDVGEHDLTCPLLWLGGWTRP